MSNPRLEDHLVGLELQLVELVENKQRADVQGRAGDAANLEAEIALLQTELASTADQIAETSDADMAPPADVHAQTASSFRAA